MDFIIKGKNVSGIDAEVKLDYDKFLRLIELHKQAIKKRYPSAKDFKLEIDYNLYLYYKVDKDEFNKSQSKTSL